MKFPAVPKSVWPISKTILVCAVSLCFAAAAPAAFAQRGEAAARTVEGTPRLALTEPPRQPRTQAATHTFRRARLDMRRNGPRHSRNTFVSSARGFSRNTFVPPPASRAGNAANPSFLRVNSPTPVGAHPFAANNFLWEDPPQQARPVMPMQASRPIAGPLAPARPFFILLRVRHSRRSPCIFRSCGRAARSRFTPFRRCIRRHSESCIALWSARPSPAWLRRPFILNFVLWESARVRASASAIRASALDSARHFSIHSFSRRSASVLVLGRRAFLRTSSSRAVLVHSDSASTIWTGDSAYGNGYFYSPAEEPPPPPVNPTEDNPPVEFPTYAVEYPFLPAPLPPPVPNSGVGQGTAAQPVVQLVLKDGTIFGVNYYWLADGRLNYITTYNIQTSIPIDDLDLQKTVDLNYKRGVTFALTPQPPNSQNPQPPQPPDSP